MALRAHLLFQLAEMSALLPKQPTLFYVVSKIVAWRMRGSTKCLIVGNFGN